MELEITMQAQHREIVGKKVRRLRRQGWIPGVLYGRGMDPTNVQVEERELKDVYRQAGMTALVGVFLESQAEPQPVLIRELQRDAFGIDILHVDLEVVDLKQVITANVPIELVGKSPVEEEGEAVVARGLEEIEVECLPAEVPSRIRVDVSTITSFDQVVLVRDLEVPEGVKVLTEPDNAVAHVTTIRFEEEVPEEEEELPLEIEELAEELEGVPEEMEGEAEEEAREA